MHDDTYCKSILVVFHNHKTSLICLDLRGKAIMTLSCFSITHLPIPFASISRYVQKCRIMGCMHLMLNITKCPFS